MSAQASAWVLTSSQSTGSTRLVLLSLANHVDPDGEGWAHVRTVLRESRVSPDSYRRAIRWAEEHGELERVIQKGGDDDTPARFRPNLFRFIALRPA